MPSVVKSMFILFLAQSCIGMNIVLSKGLIDHINPTIILAIRFSVASIFMSLLLLGSSDPTRFKLNLSKADWMALLAKGLGAGILFNFVMLSGLYFTNANSAGLITSLLPAIVICLNVMFFKQKLTKKMLTAIVISVAGLVLINLGALSGNTKNALLGNLLVLLALVPEGLYYAISKFHPVKINTLLKVLLLNALNLPFLCLIIIFIPASNWSVITLHDWMLISTIGLTTGLFFIFWQKGVQHIDTTHAALSTAFMPLATVILAWIILGETLSITKLLGMLLVILSIISYARK
jgi:drug/metabolite transporter (DMT)-like permease